MSVFLGELIGTMLLIIFGGGVVGGVVLSKSKAKNSGWIVITMG
jgi:glycerol uptake facilitator protein